MIIIVFINACHDYYCLHKHRITSDIDTYDQYMTIFIDTYDQHIKIFIDTQNYTNNVAM